MRNKAGQTTSEYLVAISLTAVAAIGLFSVYGAEIRMKVAMLTSALGGNQDTYQESQELQPVIGYEANERARREVDMTGAEAEELSYGLQR
jgi:hypothetical protein